MFDFVARHKKLVQFGLFLVFVPFILVGAFEYFRGGGGAQVIAEVGDYQITREEFSRALRDRQQALQQLAQGRIEPGMLDSPELRYSTLEGLIQRRVLLDRALRSGMTIGDAQLQEIIAELPLFRDDTNKFSFARYEQFLKYEGMTPVMFEARLRQDLMLEHLKDGYAGSNFVPKTVIEQLVRLSEQQREVSHHTIAPDKYLGRAQLEADAAQKHYAANPDEFRVPEQVRIEYLVLSPDALVPRMQVSAAEVDAAFQQQVVSVGKERERARARAEEVLAELRRNPARFEELAKKHSQDPGSAANGGDLGFFGRGVMTKAFEDAVFKLKEGEISPIVSSDFGFHIIRVTGVRPVAGAKGKGEERRASHVLFTAPKEAEIKGGKSEIELELKRQAARRRFAETADSFNNVVYEQSESLKAAAELINSEPRQSGWITREGGGDNALLANPKLLQAVFSEDVLKNKHNTEVVEVAANTLVAARVIEHKPAAMQPFESIHAALEKKLRLREAGKLAAEEGRKLLEQLRQGKAAQIAWSAPQLISRSDHKGLPEPVVQQAFRLDAGKSPSYGGFEAPQGGYTLVRMTRVVEPSTIPGEKRDAFVQALRQLRGQEEFGAYVASLKKKAEVTIRKEQFEATEQAPAGQPAAPPGGQPRRGRL
ncbi:MAG: peptidylprolyl isomerase [Betaproteobacteria bacterium]|nr:peptidylprolyl isomerase [Betaproteobacteria bacterium]